MEYYDAVIITLKEANPKTGLPLRSIVRHVYNMTCCDMFSEGSYEDVRKIVTRIVHKDSKAKDGVIEKSNKRGYYKINKNKLAALESTILFPYIIER